MSSTFISAVAAADQPLLGCSITLSSLIAAKIIARVGYKWALIEMEHSPQSPSDVTNLVHAVVAASGGKCFPLVRIPSHGVEWIKWALDAGAAGIIIPMVNTAEEMRSLVDKALYPPRGSRSYGPVNAVYANTDPTFSAEQYVSMAQDGGVAIIPMIESREGLSNVKTILSVDGVSAVFVGPKDLRMSLTPHYRKDELDVKFNEALTSIVSAARDAGVPIGTVAVGAKNTTSKPISDMDFLLCGLDRQGLVDGITQQLQVLQQALGSEYQSAA